MENTTPSKGRRAAKACSFCRRRKVGGSWPETCIYSNWELLTFVQLRCDNEQPACSSCRSHGKECTYVIGSEKQRYGLSNHQFPSSAVSHVKRPTKARISRLLAENQQLHQQLASVEAQSECGSGSAGPSPRQTQPEAHETPFSSVQGRSGIDQDPTSSGFPRSVVSRILISPNGDSSYHGPTSTLFDDAPMDHNGQSRPTDPQPTIEHTQKRLMGEAAYQRESSIAPQNPNKGL